MLFTSSLASLNYLAAVVAALVAFFLGALWYSALFGKAWQRAHGYTPEDVKAAQARRPMPIFFAGMILSYLVAAVAVGVLIRALGITAAGPGALTGLCVWLVVAAYAMTGHLAGTKPPAAYAIDAGFAFIFLPTIGAILGAWH